MNDGFIKIPRSLIDWQWYTDANVFHLYIHLFFKAAFKDGEWQNEKIKKGQVITGRKRLAEELGISENQVRTALQKLEKSGDITIKTTNKYSLITLLKWAEYEEKHYSFTEKSLARQKQTTNKTPHNNKYNNANNVNNKGARTRGRDNSGIIDSIDWSLMDQIINGDM